VKIEELMSEDVIVVGPETSERRRRDSPNAASQPAGHQRATQGHRRRFEADILVRSRARRRSTELFGWLLGGGMADDARLTARTAGEAMTSQQSRSATTNVSKRHAR
jgi:hypothetical protein